MPEGSRGLSDQRERHPRKAFAEISILEGCQTFCDLSGVVNTSAFSGGVVIPLARDDSTPGYLLAALRADGTGNFVCNKVGCARGILPAGKNLSRYVRFHNSGRWLMSRSN